MNTPTVVTDDDDDSTVYHLNKLNETQQEELHQKLKVTKNVVKGGKRETATEDLIWGCHTNYLLFLYLAGRFCIIDSSFFE